MSDKNLPGCNVSKQGRCINFETSNMNMSATTVEKAFEVSTVLISAL
jgi:hypothetical protein